ncbi:MAG: hypothetical protein PF442_00030, partial [Desulfobulbaceae bacterium]|nr:hypothetical protein [Desulfobulbaceae bacterium]
MKLRKIQDTVDTFLDEKVTDLDANVKIVAIIALVLIPIIAFYFVVYSPKSQELAQLEQQKITLLQSI